MKKGIITLLIFCTVAITSYSQTFNMRTNLSDYDYIAVQLSQTALGSQADPISSADNITNLVFTVRWLTSYGDADIDIICTNYNITESGSRGTLEGYYYQSFSCSSPLASPDDYVLGEYEDITLLEATFSGSTSGTFEIAPSSWVTSIVLNVEWNTPNPPSIEYFPSLVTGACDNTPIPTTVYNYVWVGPNTGPGSQRKSWERAGNWRGVCVGDAPPESSAPYYEQVPNTHVFIPADCIVYPETSYGTDPWGWACNSMFIASGAHVTVPDLVGNITSPANLNIDGNLTVEGTLNLPPLGYATVTGSTTINSAEGIIVQADATGVGSFINNGTISGSGTAKVQTFLTNSAGSGNFDIHLVGPTVDEENYTGAGTGAFLEEFILGGTSTYAYEWDESVTNNEDAWINLTSLTDEIYSAKGIGISTTDNNDYTLSMTGALITGAVSSPALTFSNNHYELISNPYPSTIDFDGLAGTDNSSLVQNKYWIWNPDGNTWVANVSPYSGDQKYLQVGQGFFVETKQGGTFNFTNARRSHNNVAYRDIIPNKLVVKVYGGQDGYEDKMSVRFDDYATVGYDIEIEAEKWESLNDDATQIWSIIDGNINLSANVLPTTALTSGMTSVPMNFSCGYNTEYTISFFDMETFEIGTEIWLEDKLTGDEWISVNDNPDYTFTASADDLEDRFVLHFFGPTGVDEFSVENTVDIFSYRQSAFVRNNTNEVIKEVNIYTLAGELLQSNKPSDLKLTKFWVSDNMGYYVVRVITDKNVYTEKVFISK